MDSPNNTTLIIVAIIAAIPSTFAAIFAGLALWRTAQNSKTLGVVEKKVGVVDEKVNGMSHALVVATAGQNLAEGQLKERDAERAHLSENPTNGDTVKVQMVKPDIEQGESK